MKEKYERECVSLCVRDSVFTDLVIRVKQISIVIESLSQAFKIKTFYSLVI